MLTLLLSTKSIAMHTHTWACAVVLMGARGQLDSFLLWILMSLSLVVSKLLTCLTITCFVYLYHMIIRKVTSFKIGIWKFSNFGIKRKWKTCWKSLIPHSAQVFFLNLVQNTNFSPMLTLGNDSSVDTVKTNIQTMK